MKKLELRKLIRESIKEQSTKSPKKSKRELVSQAQSLETNQPEEYQALADKFIAQGGRPQDVENKWTSWLFFIDKMILMPDFGGPIIVQEQMESTDDIIEVLERILETWETKEYESDEARWNEYHLDIEEVVEDFKENRSIDRPDTNIQENKFRIYRRKRRKFLKNR